MDILLQVGVKALLKNKEGKYLILKRSAETYPEVKELWDIVGGRIIPGSPLLDNLKREVKEETQLELKDIPALVYAQDIVRIPGRHVVRLTYTAAIEGEPVIDKEEFETFQWMTLDEICALPGMDSYFLEVVKSGNIN